MSISKSAPDSVTLSWLETHATKLWVQCMPAYRRQKNRVVLEYRQPDGTLAAVGGVCISHAVSKAKARLSSVEMGGMGVAMKGSRRL